MSFAHDTYIVLADTILVLHVAIVLFIVGGQILIILGWWRRWAWVRLPWFRYLHLTAITIVLVDTWIGLPCPLTSLENSLRLSGGGEPYAASFIGYWANRLLFYQAAGWVFMLVYTVFGIIVLWTLYACPPRRRR